MCLEWYKMSFKKGDRVIKARPFRKDKYCKWGGDKAYVPIGTKGTITQISDINDAKVSFDNGLRWSVSQEELDPYKSSLMDLEYKETPKVPEINYSDDEDEEEPEFDEDEDR